jgi:predicted small secreted protein
MMNERRMTTRGRWLLAVVLLGLTAVALAGCNTVKGIGQDITAIGQGGQEIIDGGV